MYFDEKNEKINIDNKYNYLDFDSRDIDLDDSQIKNLDR